MIRIKDDEDYTKLIKLGFKFNDERGRYSLKCDNTLIYINSWNGRIFIHTIESFTNDFIAPSVLYKIFKNFEIEELNDDSNNKQD